jgi:large subunit ribosomal protein L7Ae
MLMLVHFCPLKPHVAKDLFKLLLKYRTESRKEKKERLKKEAVAQAEKKPAAETKKPLLVKYGLNHVTSLIENNAAQLVVIAHNVDPIELVLHVPTLCRKKGIPFCFVKGLSFCPQPTNRYGKTRKSLQQEAH